jgi:chemotaxis protein histidine kinase CheA
MTIRHRITLLVVLMFVALSAIGGYAALRSQHSAAAVRDVTQGVVPSALASADLVAQLKTVQLATMTLVYSSDPELTKQAEAQLQAAQGAVQTQLALQKRDAHTQAQKGLVAQATESLANYYAAINDTVKMKVAGKDALAQANLFANVGEYQTELEGIVNTLRIEKNRDKDEAIATLNGSLATTVTAISAVTLFAVLLLTTIGIVLYRQIAGPLGKMQKMMSEIANSQDFTRRLPVDRMDEVGHSIVAFNGMIERIQQGAAQLKQKNADIQAMLQNMQQGILTVIPQAAGAAHDHPVVHPEYSAHLESIFETQDVAGRDVMALVFADTTLGADALSQVEAAMGACLGEDMLNFAFNQDLLVREVEKRMPDGRVKILDLSWSAITDEEDVILRLMLCIRDVTELRELAAEASEQKHRLEIIGEILAVSQEKFDHFLDSANSFVSENERIIRETSHADSDAIAELFRNMHTVKGNARTYNLQHLTNVVHETEQTYDALRRPESAAPSSWDQDALMVELSRVREALERYESISATSLGRKAGAGDIGGMRGDDAEWIAQSLQLLEHTDVTDKDAALAMRDAVRHRLSLLTTRSFNDALSGVFGSLPSLARELGKAPPAVLVDDNGYRLRDEGTDVLKNVFMHLLRNSIDHGIETAEERVAIGKAPNGVVELDVAAEGETIRLTLSDDGRGLALGRIRDKALEKGWLDDGDVIDDEAMAHLIFRPGFSTATTVSEVSGRGVGMDAVRDFVARHFGTIALQFTDTREGEAFRAFQTVIRLPRRLFVDGLPTMAEMPKDANVATIATSAPATTAPSARPMSRAADNEEVLA